MLTPKMVYMMKAFSDGSSASKVQVGSCFRAGTCRHSGVGSCYRAGTQVGGDLLPGRCIVTGQLANLKRSFGRLRFCSVNSIRFLNVPFHPDPKGCCTSSPTPCWLQCGLVDWLGKLVTRPSGPPTSVILARDFKFMCCKY